MTISSIDNNKDGFRDFTSLPVISKKITSEAQRPELDSIIELFSINLTKLGGTIFHFVKGIASDGLYVKYGGVEYHPVDFETEGWELSGEGAPARPKIRIGKVNSPIFTAIRNADDMVNCDVIRTRTFRKYLDDGSDPDPEAHFPKDYYKIEQKTSANRLFIEFELSSDIDQEGRKVPGRRILRDYCPHRYRDYDSGSFNYEDATCPYAGDRYFNSYGEAVDLPQDDICGKQLFDCKLRFVKEISLEGSVVIESTVEPNTPNAGDYWIDTSIVPNRINQAIESLFWVFTIGDKGTPPGKDNAYFPYSEGAHWGDMASGRIWRLEKSGSLDWIEKAVVSSNVKPSSMLNGQYWFNTDEKSWQAYSISFYSAGHEELPFGGFPGAGSMET